MKKLTTVLIASDHAGVELKKRIQELLPDFAWQDLGPANESRVDYPDYAAKLCSLISDQRAKHGILICGSGVGMSISANKVAGIRAALAFDPITAGLSRAHNDAQVLCLGSRFLAAEYAAHIARTFLTTPFSNDDRHRARIKKMSQLEKKPKRKA